MVLRRRTPVGRLLGSPRRLDEMATLEAHRFMAQKGFGVDEIARRLSVSRNTLIRSLERLGLWRPGRSVDA